MKAITTTMIACTTPLIMTLGSAENMRKLASKPSSSFAISIAGPVGLRMGEFGIRIGIGAAGIGAPIGAAGMGAVTGATGLGVPATGAPGTVTTGIGEAGCGASFLALGSFFAEGSLLFPGVEAL